MSGETVFPLTAEQVATLAADPMSVVGARAIAAEPTAPADWSEAARAIVAAADAVSAAEEHGGLVGTDDGCPDCGERRVDFLIISDTDDGDDLVRCATCGATYLL